MALDGLASGVAARLALPIWLAASALCHQAAADNSPLCRAIPAGGAQTRTLVVYDAPARPYSLTDVSKLVALLISRIQTEIELAPANEAQASQIADADYLIFLGVADEPGIPGRYWDAAQDKPVLGIGTAAGHVPGVALKMPKAEAASPFHFLRDGTLEIGEAILRSPVGAYVKARVEASTSVRVHAWLSSSGERQPLAWQEGNRWAFAALPTEEAVGWAFSELLLEFFGVQDPGKSGVLLVLDGFHAGVEGRVFHEVVQAVGREAGAFAMGFDPDFDRDALLPAQVRELFICLEYAKAMQGRIFINPGRPLWDVKDDRPQAASEITASLARTRNTLNEWIARDFFPFGLRLPGTGVSREAARIAAETFNVGIGNLQVSDATASVSYAPGTVAAYPDGITVLPLQFWISEQGLADSDVRRMEGLLQLRGTVAGVAIPAWMPIGRLAPGLDRLGKIAAPRLDPINARVRVATDQYVVTSFGTITGMEKPSPLRFFGRAGELIREVTILPEERIPMPADAAFGVMGPPKEP